MRETVRSSLMTQTAPAPTAIVGSPSSGTGDRPGIRRGGHLDRPRHLPRIRVEPVEAAVASAVLGLTHTAPAPAAMSVTGPFVLKALDHPLGFWVDTEDGAPLQAKGPDGALPNGEAARRRVGAGERGQPCVAGLERGDAVPLRRRLLVLAASERRDGRGAGRDQQQGGRQPRACGRRVASAARPAGVRRFGEALRQAPPPPPR